MKILLALMIFVVLATIGIGVRLYQRGCNTSHLKKALVCNIALYTPMVLTALFLMIPKISYAQATDPSASGLAFLGAAMSTGLAAIGSGIAVGSVGAAAVGAISENEKMLGKTLIFAGLGEGIAIYGLIISIIILGRI